MHLVCILIKSDMHLKFHNPTHFIISFDFYIFHGLKDTDNFRMVTVFVFIN